MVFGGTLKLGTRWSPCRAKYSDRSRSTLVLLGSQFSSCKVGLRPFLWPYSEGKKYSVSLSPDGGPSRCLHVKSPLTHRDQPELGFGAKTLGVGASQAGNKPPQRARGRPLHPPARNICAKESATNAKRPPPAGAICSAAQPLPRGTTAAARPPLGRLCASGSRPGRTRDSARRGPAQSPGWRGGGLGGPWKRELRKSPTARRGLVQVQPLLEILVRLQRGPRFGHALHGHPRKAFEPDSGDGSSRVLIFILLGKSLNLSRPLFCLGQNGRNKICALGLLGGLNRKFRVKGLAQCLARKVSFNC